MRSPSSSISSTCNQNKQVTVCLDQSTDLVMRQKDVLDGRAKNNRSDFAMSVDKVKDGIELGCEAKSAQLAMHGVWKRTHS